MEKKEETVSMRSIHVSEPVSFVLTNKIKSQINHW